MFSRGVFMMVKKGFCLVMLFTLSTLCFAADLSQNVLGSRSAMDEVKKCGKEACKCSPVGPLSSQQLATVSA